MPAPDHTGSGPKTEYSEQYIQNYSFDNVLKILCVGLLAYNATLDRIDRLQIDNASGGLLVTTTNPGGGSGGGGDASAANQTNGNQKSRVLDGSGNAISSTTDALQRGLDVWLLNPEEISVAAGGDATAANQQTEITRLTSIRDQMTDGTQKSQVTNFPANQTVSGTVTANKGTGWVDPQTNGLTDAQLRATAIQVKDDYQNGEILADQTGSNGVLTFTFSSPVQLIWVTDTGATTTNISRVDPFGGTPTASLGIPVANATPTPITVNTTTVKIYAPSGSTLNVYGYRRA